VPAMYTIFDDFSALVSRLFHRQVSAPVPEPLTGPMMERHASSALTVRGGSGEDERNGDGQDGSHAHPKESVKV